MKCNNNCPNYACKSVRAGGETWAGGSSCLILGAPVIPNQQCEVAIRLVKVNDLERRLDALEAETRLHHGVL